MGPHSEQHGTRLRTAFQPVCLLAMLMVFAASRCQAQAAPTTTQLTLSSHAVAQGTVIVAAATVADTQGAVAGGQVDFFDGTQLAGTVQVVRTAASGNTVGTATLRQLYGPGVHMLRAAYRGTATEAASSSSVQLLSVTGSIVGASALPAYAGTRDLADGPVYGIIYQTAMADFNGDGILDIAATEFDEPTVLSVTMGDPAHPGQFLAPAFYPISADEIDVVTAIDYDGDGLVDLIVSDEDGAAINLLRNDPANPGTFLAPVRLNLPPTLAMADFTRHGLPDLIGQVSVTNNIAMLGLYVNDTANGGTFKATSTIPAAIRTVFAIQAVDVNGDGYPDLVLNGEDATVAVYTVVLLADPANPGKFLAPVLYPDGSFLTCMADLNGDGLPDMVSSIYTGVVVRLNDQTHPGTFLPSVFYAANGAFILSCGDVDGDGKVDVVAGSGGTSPATLNIMQILHGNGDGTLSPPVSVMTGPTAPAWESSSILIADLDGDGLGDIVASSLRQNALQIFLHQAATVPLVRTATDLSASLGYIVYSNQTQVLTATETTTAGTLSGTVEFYDTYGGALYQSIGTAPILNGVATLSIPNVVLGFHDYQAVFHGDATYAPSESAGVGTYVKQAGATTLTSLTANPNPSPLGQAVLLSATVSGPVGSSSISATGTVTFMDGNTVLGMATLAGNVASLSVSNLTAGTHPVTAVYGGDPGDSGSVSPVVNVIVQGAASQAVLTSLPNPAQYGSSVTLSAAVTSTVSGLSGSITFLDGTTTLGSIVLTSGTATLSISTLTPGTHSLTAMYSGDATHNSATSNSVTEQITGAPSSVSLSTTPSPAVSFQTIMLSAQLSSTVALGGTKFSGQITFYANSIVLGSSTANAAGTATLTTVALGAGNYTLTATFAGNTSFVASTSVAVPEQVLPDATTTTLTATPNPARQQQGVSYSISARQTFSTQAPAGTVTLLDGANVIGSGTLDAHGNLTGVVSSLAPGTHLLTAVYAGNANFTGSSSAETTLVVLTQDFSVTPSVDKLSIVTEHHAPLNVVVASLGDLQDAVTFTCLNLPVEATCTFGSSRMQLNSAAIITNSLMIDTDYILNYADATPGGLTGGVSICLMLGGWTLLETLNGRRRRKWNVLLAGCLTLSAIFVSGCSGKYPAHTTPGTYVVTVEVRGEQTGIVHTVPITLTVLP